MTTTTEAPVRPALDKTVDDYMAGLAKEAPVAVVLGIVHASLTYYFAANYKGPDTAYARAEDAWQVVRVLDVLRHRYEQLALQFVDENQRYRRHVTEQVVRNLMAKETQLALGRTCRQ